MTTETQTEEAATFTLRDAMEAADKELRGEVEDASQEAQPETSTEEEPQEEIEASTDETTSEESTEETPDEEVSEVETIQAPENWSDEDKTAFKTLTSEGQEWALRVDKQYKAGLTSKTEEIADLTKALEPFESQIALSGRSRGELVRNLLSANAALQRDPVGTLIQLANSMRVDPKLLGEKLGLTQAESSEDEYIDPSIKALQEKVDGLTSQLTQAQQKSQTDLAAQGQKMLDDFRDAKNEDGTKKNPHLEAVLPFVIAFVQADPSLSLEDAYDRAVMADPKLRVDVIKAEKEKALKEAKDKAEKERKAKVNEAKKSSTKLKGKKAASTETEVKPKSIKGFVQAADAELRGV